MDTAREDRRVLIIDEEGNFSRALAVYLSDLGLRASTASNWTEALNKILDERPEVILIDPHLNTVTGEAILGFLREEGDLTPVVVVSDHLDAKRAEMLKSLGANEFVQKTDAFYQIAQAVSRVMPEWSAEGAPVMTDEEFQQIVEQRLKEVFEESRKDRRPGQLFSSPRASQPDAGAMAVRGPAEKIPPSPVASSYSSHPQEPVPLPPPPPFPSGDGGGQRVRRVRRRRGGRSGSRARWVFVLLFAVCLLAGAIYMAVTMGLADFIRAEGPGTERGK